MFLSLLPLDGEDTRELVEEKVECDMERTLLRIPLLSTLARSISSGDFSELRKLEYPLDGVGLCLERFTIVTKSPFVLWWALFGVSPRRSGLEEGFVLLALLVFPVAMEEGVWCMRAGGGAM